MLEHEKSFRDYLRKDFDTTKSSLQRFEVDSASELQALREVADSVGGLSRTYERKLTWRARFRPIRGFVQQFVGMTKKTKDLLDLQEKVKKLLD